MLPLVLVKNSWEQIPEQHDRVVNTFTKHI